MLGLLGMMAQLAGIAVLGPISWSAGALFGAKQFRDERRRQRERQRQEARTLVRQFLGSAEVELTRRLEQSTRDAHHAVRDFFAARIEELGGTYESTVEAMERSLAADEAERATLATATRQRIAELDELAEAIERADRLP